MIRPFSFILVLVLVGVVFLTGCGGEAAGTPANTPAPAVPAETPTAAPLETPTETPAATPTNTPRPTAQVFLEWGLGGVRPADSDDVDAIVLDVMHEEGIVSGYGNEQGVTIRYNPTLITVEEIQEVFQRIGHPVVIIDE